MERDRRLSESRARWAVAAIFLANGFVVGSWAAQIPLVKERLSIGHDELGLALFAMAAGALCAMALGGAAIARFGSAAVVSASALVCFAAFPLAIFAPALALLLPAAFVFGAANGLLDVAMNAHGVMVESRIGRPFMSSFHGMWSLGGLLGAGFSGLLLSIVAASAAALFASGLALAGAVPALLNLLPAGADSDRGGPGFVLPDRATFALGALCFLAMTTEGAVLDWSALHLKDRLDLGAGVAATGFAAFAATMAAGRFVGDWLRARVAAVPLVRASAFLAAAGLAVALAAPMPALAVAGFAVVGLGMSNLVPIFISASARIPGHAPGTAIAAVATMGYVGFLAGPPVIGAVAEVTSLTLALALIVLACLLIGVSAAPVAPRRRAAFGARS